MNVYLKPQMGFSKTRTHLDRYISILARLLIGGFFVYSGIDNLQNPIATANELGIDGALFLVATAGVFKFLLGLGVMFKYHTKYAAMGLSIYLGVVSLAFYGPHLWTEHEIFRFIFIRNIAIIGGLLFISAHSRGWQQWQEEFIPKRQRDIGKENQPFNDL